MTKPNVTGAVEAYGKTLERRLAAKKKGFETEAARLHTLSLEMLDKMEPASRAESLRRFGFPPKE